MKRLRFAPTLLLAGLLVCTPSVTWLGASKSAAHSQTQREKKEVTVWLNTRSGVYWCPGGRWYGKTKQGKYMGECEALKEGYRPAYGRPCGSQCAKEAE